MAFLDEVGGLTYPGGKDVYVSAYCKGLFLVCHLQPYESIQELYLRGTISEFNLDILVNAVCIPVLHKC